MRLAKGLRAVFFLVLSWAAGLATYAAALAGVRGEILSLDNWLIIGSVTLVAWLVASGIAIVPVLTLLASRSGPPGPGKLPVRARLWRSCRCGSPSGYGTDGTLATCCSARPAFSVSITSPAD
jgi:hypothetical protein